MYSIHFIFLDKHPHLEIKYRHKKSKDREKETERDENEEVMRSDKRRNSTSSVSKVIIRNKKPWHSRNKGYTTLMQNSHLNIKRQRQS